MSRRDERERRPAPWRTQTAEETLAAIQALYHPGPLPQQSQPPQPRQALCEYDELPR